MARRATVVGGGIAGLAAAVGLRRAGWDVEVHERRRETERSGARPDQHRETERSGARPGEYGPGGAGSGISLWPNALRALDALGLGATVRDVGTVQAAGGIRTRDGRWLLRTDAETLRARHGDGVVVLPRADLLGILRAALPEDVVALGSVVDDPTTLDADLVVGADGIGSAVRRHHRPDSVLRRTGTEASRLVAEIDDAPREGGESWGDGDYAGVAPWADGRRVQMWAVTPTGAVDDLDGLRRRFAGWHHPIPAVLAAASSAHRTELSWLPPLRSLVVDERTVLVGDAGHAMTPNMGQGGCQALEDAAVLGHCLGADVATGLREYDARRRPRVARLTRMSRAAGLVAGLPSPLSRVRDAVGRVVPTAIAVRGTDATLGWRPPS